VPRQLITGRLLIGQRLFVEPVVGLPAHPLGLWREIPILVLQAEGAWLEWATNAKMGPGGEDGMKLVSDNNSEADLARQLGEIATWS